MTLLMISTVLYYIIRYQFNHLALKPVFFPLKISKRKKKEFVFKGAKFDAANNLTDHVKWLFRPFLLAEELS